MRGLGGDRTGPRPVRAREVATIAFNLSRSPGQVLRSVSARGQVATRVWIPGGRSAGCRSGRGGLAGSGLRRLDGAVDRHLGVVGALALEWQRRDAVGKEEHDAPRLGFLFRSQLSIIELIFWVFFVIFIVFVVFIVFIVFCVSFIYLFCVFILFLS